MRSNYWGITILSLPGKVYSRVLERRVRLLVETRTRGSNVAFILAMEQWTRSMLLRVLEGTWEFAQPVHMCFVDLEKAYDQGVLWGVLQEYGVAGLLLLAVQSLYCRSQSLQRFHCWQEVRHVPSQGWSPPRLSFFTGSIHNFHGHHF